MFVYGSTLYKLNHTNPLLAQFICGYSQLHNAPQAAEVALIQISGGLHGGQQQAYGTTGAPAITKLDTSVIYSLHLKLAWELGIQVACSISKKCKLHNMLTIPTY